MTLAKDSTIAASSSPRAIGIPSSPINSGIRSEAGIGSLMPWGGYLYFHTYPAENSQERGTGLWRMDKDWKPSLIAEVNQTDPGRTIWHNRLYMGKFEIGQDNQITPITGFGADDRLTAWSREPVSDVLFALTMGGRLYSFNETTKAVTFVSDAKAGLGITAQAHFKSLWGSRGRLYAGSNIEWPYGAFGWFNVSTSTWQIATAPSSEWAGFTAEARGSHIETAGSYYKNQHVFATGLADAGHTGCLWLISGRPADSANDGGTPSVRRFRIPLSHRQQIIGWQQEWMRIRQADTERYLMDFHGGWFQLSAAVQNPGDTDLAGDGFPILEPISRHVRTNTDFCIWNGHLIVSGNQTTEQTSNQFPNSGTSQAALVVYQSTDELYQLGRPQGTGFFCRGRDISANSPSEYMLMRGYDKKALFLSHASAAPVEFKIEVVKDAKVYTYATVTAQPGALTTHLFPAGFTADWFRITPTTATTSLDAWVEYS